MALKSLKLNKIKYVLILIFIFLLVYIIVGNTKITPRTIIVEDKNIPNGFSGYKIAHISDLHNKNWKEKLINPLKNQNPDVIFITGDLIDSRTPDFDVAYNFVKEAVKIAPTYYVSGNHELRFSNFNEILENLRDLGVNVLDNERTTMENNNDEILLLGLPDVTGIKKINPEESDSSRINRLLKPLASDSDNYKILLSHRPEQFSVYQENNINLTFSGHAHGGQIVLPFIGPIIAPHQGLFPKLTDGLYEENDSKLIVSRGLGNSLFPIRFNDDFDLIFVELKKTF